MSLKIIAFDADDTLFVNEPYFVETENKFSILMQNYCAKQIIHETLYNTQIKNLPIYGYGIKGYILSMIETAIKTSNNTVNSEIIEQIIQYGKEMQDKPIVLLDGLEKTLQALQRKYKLIVATKGDLLDQRRKLHRSGIGHYFHHIEVMTEKNEIEYTNLIKRLEITPKEFLMIGNSLKSDVLPVLKIGAQAIHIPFVTTWKHEEIEQKTDFLSFKSIKKLEEIINLIG